jgi:hypothetical protein
MAPNLIFPKLGPQLVALARGDCTMKMLSSPMDLYIDEFIAKWTIRR